MPQPGRTAVVIPVPELDPVLGAVATHRPDAVRPGIPAHLTLLYPFVPAPELTGAAVDRCRALCAGTGPVRVTFRHAVAGSSMVATTPEPAGPLAALARALREAWPEHPPYGGRFGPDPDPHVTLALDPGPDAAALAVATGGLLPVDAVLSAAALVELTADGWRQRAALPL
ncbi:2'-5' RNA ligase family protein [Pseudonocardia sp. C8]|uniref:2'-5' RNA ligase family protein n=1 Tax=Pseudonocardia sp. C8 TaxID=2762759 RepID=UPI0016423539|nr:2'-5' RNA ligase family protein [Pseudonocardia sp. C8]